MKIDPNAPAFPNSNQYSDSYIDGLTIRAHFAGMAMAAHAANPEQTLTSSDKIAAWSVEMADALIDELNK